MKYTIELTNKQKAQMDCMIDIVHRYVGFNPKLEPIKTTNVEDTYNVVYYKALEDVNHAIDVLKDMTVAECKEWFGGCIGIDDVVCAITIQDIIGRTKAYEETKKSEDTIECGDEVTILKNGITGIVFAIKGGVYEILSSDAKWNKLLENQIKKTGRNFKTEVMQLLDRLRGEEK